MMKEARFGYCECGCDELAPIAKKTCGRLGHVKGQPVRFIHNHHLNGEGNPRWNNGKTMFGGYVYIQQPEHHRATHAGYVKRSILNAEKAMGKPLPLGVEVHHAGKRTDDDNIVVCENHAYHMLLHMNSRALKACGDPDKRKCTICKKWDDQTSLVIRNGGGQRKTAIKIYHAACFAEDQRKRRQAIPDRRRSYAA